ncbi:hypothetical protein [Pseudoalteromonas maricaloris]|uniref:hypothetical protein n=1 Tax=Pseudoalteromonas maricaloris TaxID=184924 RepID=UPI003C17A6FC
MAWTIQEALKDESIEKTEVTGEGYSFWLKGISTEISVVLSVNPINQGFNFKLSHYIKAPTQIYKYTPSRPWGDDEAYALHLAITAITKHYKDAVREGHSPSTSWLIPNKI